MSEEMLFNLMECDKTIGSLEFEGQRLTFHPEIVLSFMWPFDDKGFKYGDVTFDFGMSMTVPLEVSHNMLINGYRGLNKDSSPEDIMLNTAIFDIEHALCHPTCDPNYNYIHWAIYGWLKDRVAYEDLPL